MNPYRILKKFRNALGLITPAVLYAGGLTSFWLPFSFAVINKPKAIENFTQTEIFKNIKAEEEAKLDTMKVDVQQAQIEMFQGHMLLSDFQKLNREYNQQYEYINSQNFVIDTMKQYDEYYNKYNQADTSAVYCGLFGGLYAFFGIMVTGCLTAGAMCKYDDNCPFIFDEKIDEYDNKKSKKVKEIKQNSKEMNS